MNFHQLLQLRDALVRQSRLANTAFAWHRLALLGERIARAGLRGLVRLRPADEASDIPWPTLTALEGSQAVIEEHFTDEDIVDLSDVIAFVTGEPAGVQEFRLEEMSVRFGAPLRTELERAGIEIAGPAHHGLNPSEMPRRE